MAVLKDLIVHGASRFLNTVHTNDLHANTIAADNGYFNYLKAVEGDITNLTTEELLAKRATVVGLLDVKGELHTNSWTNSSIATIDGSFYICPTISGVNTVTITRAVTNSTVTWSIQLNGNLAIEDSVYTKTSAGTVSFANWTTYSSVALTGEVLVDDVWLPLGTLLGTISESPSVSRMTVSELHDNGGQFTTLETIGAITNAQARNIKISLYNFYQSNSYRPIGLYLTSTAGDKSKTFIDIYGGGNGTSTSSAYVLATETSVDPYKEYYSLSGSTYTKITDPTGSPQGQGWYVKYDSSGLALPNVRIGNLNGIKPFVVGGVNVEPTGWGIYTDNGYFKGTIVSNEGLIGSYSLTSTYLQSTDGTTGISVADNSTTANWAFWAGGNTTTTAKFRVDHSGKLYATGADIQGSIVSTNGLYVKSSPTGNYIAQMTGNGISLGDAGADGITYNGYNILIDPNLTTGGIKLRHNTNVLNKIDITGMQLFLPEDQINPIAEFKTDYAKIGADSADRMIIDTNGIHGKSSEQVEYFNIDMKSGTVEVPFTIYEDTIEGSVDNHVDGNNMLIEFPTNELIEGDIFKVSCQVDFNFLLYDYWFAGQIDDNTGQVLTYPRYWTPRFTFTYGQSQTIQRVMGNESNGSTHTVGTPFFNITANYDGIDTITINFGPVLENRNEFGDDNLWYNRGVVQDYMKKSTGSTIYNDRLYYTKGTPDEDGQYEYIFVYEPVASNISNYYEILIDDCFYVKMFNYSIAKYDIKYGPSFMLGTSIDPVGSKQPFSTIIGQELTAPNAHQIVLGKFNKSTNDMFVIGNGESDAKRNNLFRIDNTGDIYFDLGTNFYYVFSDTASNVKNKTASENVWQSSFQLTVDCYVLVHFANYQTQSSTNDLTLDVENTGAKPIYNSSTYIGDQWIYDGWEANSNILFKYNGTQWERVSWYGYTSMGDTATENGHLISKIGLVFNSQQNIRRIIKTSAGEFDVKQFLIALFDQFREQFRTKEIVTPDGTYQEVYVGDYTSRAKAWNSSLTTSSGDDLWLQATIASICHYYSGYELAVFKGRLSPNAQGYFEICIYNTSNTNYSSLPQYSHGIWRKWQNTFWLISTNNYNFSYVAK